jgi:hypothetical protein
MTMRLRLRPSRLVTHYAALHSSLCERLWHHVTVRAGVVAFT